MVRGVGLPVVLRKFVAEIPCQWPLLHTTRAMQYCMYIRTIAQHRRYEAQYQTLLRLPKRGIEMATRLRQTQMETKTYTLKAHLLLLECHSTISGSES